MLEGISEDGPSETEDTKESDMQKLEQLFKKMQSQYKVDKVKLLKSLMDSYTVTESSAKNSRQSRAPTNKNILAGL